MTLRKGLPEVPHHMRNLPVDARGYPIPWFVHWHDGKPDFRVLDHEKYDRAVKLDLCAVCGGKLGRFKSFVGGPMNAIQMISGEPPVHRECALFSVRACPFLLLPLAKRREANLPGEIGEIGEPGDVFVKENPGISAIITCTKFKLSRTSAVFHVTDLTNVEWFTEGREATHEEITTALRAGHARLTRIRNGEEQP